MFDVTDNDKEIATTYKPKKAKVSLATLAKQEARKQMRKETAKEIIQNIGGIPKKGESFDILANGQSNAGGFYEVIRDEWDTIDCMCIATWMINRDYIDMLVKDVVDGKIKHLVFVISNRMSQLGKGHAPNFNRMKTLFMENQDKVSFRVVNSHAKTYCMTNGKEYIVVDGSGNWSKNPRIENYTITNSKTKFEFRYNWMMELCNAR